MKKDKMNILLTVLLMCAIVGTTLADRKRCFCKVVTSDNKAVVHDFGTITTHKHWLSVSCRRLQTCSDECDRKVKEWLCDHQEDCRKKTGGKSVIPFYKASVCSENYGNNVRKCGCTGGPFNDIAKCQFKCFSESNTQSFIVCFNKCLNG